MKTKRSKLRAGMAGMLFIIAVLLVVTGGSWSPTVDAGAMPQGGGRPTATPTPKPRPRSTQRPIPRATPRPAPRPTPLPKLTPKPKPTPVPTPTPRQAPQIEMVFIPAGTFMMGSPDSEHGRDENEGPQHRVTVQSFYMGKYEVTQAQWQAVMGTNPSHFKGDNLPVESVSWIDAVGFCRKLSQMTGREYRLPTEAEWEYACRAGTTTPVMFGSSLSSAQANFDGNYPYGEAAKGVYREQTSVVGSFQANFLGLYDMHGNVYEWCLDYYHRDYNGAPTDGTAWLSGENTMDRVIRGGSWFSYGYVCRSADRGSFELDKRRNVVGLRVVAVARR